MHITHLDLRYVINRQILGTISTSHSKKLNLSFLGHLLRKRDQISNLALLYHIH